MLQLDFRSRVPIYEQLIEKIKELIVHSALKDDEQLPSVRELAQELTVNPNTIQKAFRELERQGYIYSIQGKGNFVMPANRTIATRQKEELLAKLEKIISELIYLGLSKEDIAQAIEKCTKGGSNK